MSDVERLCNVRRRVFHDYRLSLSDVGLAVFSVLFQNIADNVFDKFLFGDKHVHICVYLLNLFEYLGICDSLRYTLCDKRRSLAECLSQLKARERIISHLGVLRNLYHLLNL